MAVTRQQEQALLIIARAVLMANGWNKPLVRTIVQLVDEAAKQIGLEPAHTVCDNAVRHLIAEGELKKEFDNG
jgi:hypothetical protein